MFEIRIYGKIAKSYLEGGVAIISGYQKFREKYATTMEELALGGQQPQIMAICCCDSRVDPAIILETKPGEIFTARNIANLVPPYEPGKLSEIAAALEFGVKFLRVKHLLVMGHSNCGGVQALMEQQPFEFVTSWVTSAAVATADYNDYDELAKQIVLTSCNNCLSYPWLAERVSAQQLIIHPWFFEIKTSTIYSYSNGQFRKLNENPISD